MTAESKLVKNKVSAGLGFREWEGIALVTTGQPTFCLDEWGDTDRNL